MCQTIHLFCWKWFRITWQLSCLHQFAPGGKKKKSIASNSAVDIIIINQHGISHCMCIVQKFPVWCISDVLRIIFYQTMVIFMFVGADWFLKPGFWNSGVFSFVNGSSTKHFKVKFILKCIGSGDCFKSPIIWEWKFNKVFQSKIYTKE